MRLRFWQSERSNTPLDFDEWVSMFGYGGLGYQLGLNQTISGEKEEVSGDFGGLVHGAYKRNGVVFACMLARLQLFSEARFQFRQLRSGRPGDLFGGTALVPLEKPWPGGTTGDLLARMIQDADLGGNAFVVRRPQNRVKRLRPDWVTLVLGSDTDSSVEAGDVDADVIGYLFHPGGKGSGRDPLVFLPEQVAHFAPIPDPAASFRGMSWLTPIIRELMADSAATSHKLKFFENGATSNMVIQTDHTDPEKFKKWVEMFRSQHEGVANAYKTIALGAGATSAEVVGANFKQMEFKTTQGAGETRIAAAAGVPPVIVGLSEGLAASTYSNYGQARRRFADGTMRPLWRNAAGSLARIIDVPPNAELWYDDRDIAFLQEDRKDDAEIQGLESRTIRTLLDAGYKAESVKAAVLSNDWSLLQHSGLFSVQLQKPGSENGGSNGVVDPAVVLPDG